MASNAVAREHRFSRCPEIMLGRVKLAGWIRGIGRRHHDPKLEAWRRGALQGAIVIGREAGWTKGYMRLVMMWRKT